MASRCPASRRHSASSALLAATQLACLFFPASALVVAPAPSLEHAAHARSSVRCQNACLASTGRYCARSIRSSPAAGKGTCMHLAGGGGEITKQEAKSPLRERMELFALIALWYASSVVCTNTTKSIGAHWSVLTFSQLVFSTLCGIVVVCGFGYKKYRPIANADQLQKTAVLATVFTMGFITLNWALGMMHVSLVMTLRATEPMFTLFLASVLLRAEPVTWKMGAALLPVIAGAALSSAEVCCIPCSVSLPADNLLTGRSRPQSAGVSLLGLAVVVVCNVCFALRGIVTKRIKAVYPVDEFNLFLQISALAALGYGAVLALANLVTPSIAPDVAKLVDMSQLLQAGRGGTVVLNGVTFYAYLQLSWVVLGRVAAVAHSVCK